MPGWLILTIGVGCMLWAIAQLRMTLVYLGVVQPAVVGRAAGTGALVHSALADAILFFCFALACFAVKWPQLITYVIGVLLLKSLVNVGLAYFGVGRFGVIGLTAKGRARQAALEFVPVTIYAAVFAVSAHFLGL